MGYVSVPATYNAPESAQIGSATLVAKINQEERTFKYTGNKTIISPGTGDIEGYIWAEPSDPEGYIVYSTNKASEIYSFERDAEYYSDTIFYVELDYDDYGIISGNNIPLLSILSLNAPDEEQVGKAYVVYNDYEHCVYTGRELTAIDRATGNSKTLCEYYWEEEDSSITFGGPKAQDLFGQYHTRFLRYDYDYSQHVHYWDSATEYMYPSEVYTVPYQRAETTEQWDYVSAFPTIEKRVLMKYMGDAGSYMNLPTEGFVNVNGETMEYKGKTYYKWVCIEETEAGKSKNRKVLNEDKRVLAGQTMLLLTTSLDPNLPFSPNSPEWAYLISSEDVKDIYNAQNDPIAQEAYIDKFGNMTVRT
jgi:hypothetical protein